MIKSGSISNASGSKRFLQEERNGIVRIVGRSLGLMRKAMCLALFCRAVGGVDGLLDFA